MLNLLKFIVLRHLSSKKLRISLTLAGVILGVALYTSIAIINRSTLTSYRDSLRSLAGRTSLTLTTGSDEFSESQADLARTTPGVAYVVPEIKSRVNMISADGRQESLVVLGIDLLDEHSLWNDDVNWETRSEKLVKNAISFLNHPDSIILTQSFADRHGLSVGSKIFLATTLGKSGFVVRGILPPLAVSNAYGGGIAVMDIDAARLAFGKPGKIDRLDVVADEGQDVEKLAGSLRSRFGSDYTVERPEGRAENLKESLGPFQAMLTFFGSLALLVGLFLVSNSISISVAERRGEISTLRALGATRKSILAVFLIEALLVGIAGSVLGAVSGRLLAIVMVEWVSQAASYQSGAPYLHASELSFSLSEFGKTLALGSTVCLLAALFPSYRAGFVQPLEAAIPRTAAPNNRGFYRVFPWLGASSLIFLAMSTHCNWRSHSWIIAISDQFAGIVGSLLLGPWLVLALILALRPAVRRLGGTLTRLSTDNLLLNPKRTASNAMNLLAGLLLVTMLSTLNTSFKSTIRGRYGKAVRPDLLVSSYGKIAYGEQQPLDESLAAELAKIPGTSGAYGMRMIHLPYEGRQITIKAFDETAPEIRYGLFDLKDRPAADAGYELYHSIDPTALVSENFALLFGKKTGDHVTISTPAGKVDLRIVGVEIAPSVGGGLISMSRPLFKKLWNDPLVNAFAVQVAPGSDPLAVKAQIERTLGESRSIGVTSQAEVSEKIDALIDKNFKYTRAIEAAAILVGFLGLFNTLIVSVMERRRELGMLRAIGMSKKQVYSLIFQESAILGILGSLVAIALGAWTSAIWIEHSLASSFGWLIEFHFPWDSALGLVSTGVVVAITASLLPARRAAQLEIRDALGEGEP